ncbi:MAG: DUF6798 domain-containing protein [Planctomycetota bacterium]
MSTVDASAEPAPSRSFDLRLVFAVWLSLLVYGAVAAPMPAVNEPHYLCKAKHFWQPAWCAQDFFLESPNAHTVFFVAVGGLTRWLSLAQTAWIARAAATLVLAVGWVSLTTRLLSARWSPLTACWLFLAFASCGNLSGEWLVGGVEGKVFCYGLLFASFGQVLRGRIVPAGALAGLALSFHPVVGAWGVLAFAGACVVQRGTRSAERGANEQLPSASLVVPANSALRAPRSALALILLAVLSLPGLIPVVQLLLESAPAATKYSATYIQVYYRLAHHLDPMLFPLRAYAGYAVLLVLWVCLSRSENQTAERRLFQRIVGWSMLFAFAGLLIGWGPRPPHRMPFFAERMHLLKFYPFRLADVLVPLAVSIAALRWLERKVGTAGQNAEAASETVSGVANDAEPGDSRPPLRKRKTGLTPSIGWGAVLFVLALGRAHSVVEVNRYSGVLRADWIGACRWIDQHLPTDALVQAPHNGWAFKWFAGRAEYVAFKDCPQDAAGIVEWNRRLLFLKKWYEDQYVDQFYSADELRGLRRETGITHLLTDRLGPLELEPVYRNETFQVYDLSSLD